MGDHEQFRRVPFIFQDIRRNTQNEENMLQVITTPSTKV